ncbi:ribonuclease HII [Niveibacterium umoris]|uniref:Ribonuclease HII n=1 Tax=Niveibacterium umoris TaxID=1193620 RepID=A0A840BDB2_9RHOO|nr:ribonuclease HII [Niveibacterium umoris]MBB4011511.1 ribonuclease HII [Niveibacterium umoris]
MTTLQRPVGLLAGVDEAGRGPLCGAVVAAAVILDPQRPISGLDDSKALSAKKRVALALQIRERALAWSVAEASPAEIDQLNILGATMLAMKRAVQALGVSPAEVWVDGNRCPDLDCTVRAVVGGDAKVEEISAASILAKTVRDAQMEALHERYPHLGLAQHKGYPTAAHMAALRQHGVPDFYRTTFSPVREILAQGRLF